MKLSSSAWLRLIIFPMLGLIMALAIVSINVSLFRDKNSITYTYINNAINGHGGYGDIADYKTKIPLAILRPGDILLGGWPNCGYGTFSHAGLYLGDGKVLEGYIDTGLTVNSVLHYRDYAQACILRVKTSERIKKNAVKYAIRQKGKIFYPVAFKNGERFWNCSKIIWKAYMKQNINLDKTNDLWIAPEVFYYSPDVNVIWKEGGVKN